MGKLTKLTKEMAANGYPIQDLQPDGEFHRFPVPGCDKDFPGYYLIKKNTTGYWAVYGDFVSGRKYFWKSDNPKPLSPEEAEELKAKLADEAKEFEDIIKHKHEKGAMAAQFFWETGSDANSHHYLKDKKIKGYGLKVCNYGDYANWLMVPGYNDSGKLCIVQYINRDGEKRFETGGRKKGSFFEIAGDCEKIIIAEGYSTSASIYEATGYTTAVAFDAGNLISVAKVMRVKYQDVEIIVAADNDQWKPDIGNIGVESAKIAAIEIDAKLAVPRFKNTETKPTDFNDLLNLEGLSAVKAQIQAAAAINKIEALKAEIKKISKLDLLEQEVERSHLAKKYDVRKSVIDRYIDQQSKADCDNKNVVDEVQPAENEVNGEELLNRIQAELNRRVILPARAAEAISLWITPCQIPWLLYFLLNAVMKLPQVT